MLKKYTFSFILVAFIYSFGNSQCINTTPYGTAIINSCSSGTISTCNWALEYSDLTFNTVGTFTFNSSIATDYLTLTTSANVVIASGNAPLTATIPSIGGYRLHVSTNSSCGTQNTCRVTTYACGTPTVAGGCISPTAFGNATINSCSAGTITTCNYGGEYSQLTLGTTGPFTFYSSTTTDFLTFTDDFNNILYFGYTPLSVNISSIGNYRLHVSTNTACGVDVACRTTSYDCLNTPCAGTPSGGTTTSSTGTICGSQNVSFGLNGSTIALGLSYQWQSSPNNVAWSSLPTYTNATMTQFVNASTYYRCIIACGSFTANSIPTYISYGGLPVAGVSIASSTNSCAGNSINFSLVGNSNWAGLNYQWQSSANNLSWTNLIGFTSSTMMQTVNTSTYYRCVLSCNTSTAASSSVYVASASPITYANVPYYETFDNVWQNGCDIRNVPNNQNWKSSPLTGDNSWRRQDDGISANWTTPSFGIVSPQSGLGCANFHSTEALSNAKGDLDILVNMNQNAKYAISFYYINQTGNDNLTVLLSTDAGNSFSVKGSYNNQASWTKKTIYYNAVNTPSCVVKFKGKASIGNDDLGIDSLSIRLICLNPTLTAATSTTSLCLGQSATLTVSGATNYTWNPGGITSSIAVVSPTINTNYIATGTNDGICFTTANIPILVTSCPIGIEELHNNNTSVYPNPSSGLIYVDYKNEYVTSIFELTNSLGERVMLKELNSKSNQISIENLSAGIYFYKISVNGSILKAGKLVKN